MVQNINTWYTVVEETTEVLGQRILQDYWRIRLIMSEWNMHDTMSEGTLQGVSRTARA